MMRIHAVRDFLFLLFFVLVFLLSLGHNLYAQQTLAFPGAEGFGKYSKGGRGGEIIKVTNLDDSGPGSLRNALEAEGPRIVVFEVGGLIDLETPVIIDNPYITIAGQTAPGDGIAIRGNRISIATNHVIVRFLRVRPGDQSFGPENSWEHLDAITVGGASDPSKVYNIIIDHCSLSWAIDEVFSVGHDTRNITIQNSVIAEGLSDSKHPEGHHSKGILLRHGTDNISILNNLLVHNSRRNPKVNTNGLVDVRNNVIYNPRDYGATLVNTKREDQNVNLVNNIFIPGRDTRFEHEVSIYKPEFYNGKIYMEGNSGFYGNGESNNWSMLDNKGTRTSIKPDVYNSYKSDTEFESSGADRRSKDEIMNFINNHIGASLPIRDKVDKRLVKEFNNRKGSIIDSQGEAGGWPTYLSALASVDKNGNGISDSWMQKYGVNVGEEHEDFDDDGYTNVEEYLNGTNPRDPNNSEEDIFHAGTSSIQSLESFDLVLEQNFPNPFKSETKIRFELPKGETKVYIYNSIGQKVKTLLDRNISSGVYELTWDPDRQLASGTFFLRLIHQGRAKSIPMTYIK